MRRWVWWIVGVTGTVIIVTPTLVHLYWPTHPVLRLNTSPSMPRGLYLQRHVETIRYGMRVLIQLPQALETFMVQRGYLAAPMPITKTVEGMPGEEVCVTEAGVHVQDRRLDEPLATVDSQGRALPQWLGCHVLGTKEYFVVNREDAHSFDSRYFGPVTRDQIVGEMIFLWGW